MPCLRLKQAPAGGIAAFLLVPILAVAPFLALQYFGQSSSADTKKNITETSLVKHTTANERGQLITMDLQYTQRGLGWMHVLDLVIGEPPRVASLMIDTGSDLTWVYPECGQGSNNCSYDRTDRPAVFHASLPSAHMHDIPGKPVMIEYMDGTVVEAVRSRDTIQLGELTIPDFKISLATRVVDNSLDLGLLALEPMEDNFVAQLAQKGHITSQIFGIYLGSANGSLVLGGIDAKKYTGSLFRNKVRDHYPSHERPLSKYLIQLDNLNITQAGGSSVSVTKLPMHVFVDNGHNYCSFPLTVVTEILRKLPLFRVRSFARGIEVPCFYLRDKSTAFEFTFGRRTLKIPLRNLIQRGEFNGAPECWLGISISLPGDPLILGDTFLESVYSVFDPVKMEVWFAEEAECGTNPIAIDSHSQLRTIQGEC